MESDFKEKSVDELNALSTKRLLAYYRAERKRFDVWHDGFFCECCGTPEWEFKNGPDEQKTKLRIQLWREYLDKIKSVLATREHVNN